VAVNWIVAYDVSDDDRRHRLATVLLRYGWRIQFSVFECQLSDQALAEVLEDVSATIDLEVDRVHLTPICGNCADKRVLVGQATLPPEEKFFFV